MSLPTAFELDLPPALCLGVALPPRWNAVCARSLAELPAAERDHAAQLGERRRLSWVGGRLALHRGAARLGLEPGAVLADPRGAPALPAGLCASISHSRALAVALLARADAGDLGVDIECLNPARPDIARLVLTDDELRGHQALPAPQRWTDLLLRFSAKEAVYKALYPALRRRIDFDEVQIWPDDRGQLRVEVCGELAARSPRLLASYHLLGDQVLTTARTLP